MSRYNTSPISLFPPGSAVQATDTYLATDVNDSTSSSSGTTKKYTINQLLSFAVDNYAQSNVRTSIAATTTNLVASYFNGNNNDGVGATLTNNSAFGALNIDGVAMAVGDRVLVSFQTDATENGVYDVTDIGSGTENWIMTRVADFDGSDLGQINKGDFIGVLSGTTNSLSFWFLTSASNPTIGTDNITFQKQVNVVAEPWVNQTTTPVTMSVNTGYTTSAGATQIDYALPTVAPVGTYVEITGNDTGGFVISQAAGQQINFGTTATSVGVGGSITANDQFCNIRLRCIVANDLWTVTSFVGSFTIA